MSAQTLLPVAILAGGYAKRMRPLTDAAPKAMLDIHGEPFIAHQLKWLRSQGARQVLLCVGHQGSAITDFVGSGEKFGLLASCSNDGPTLLGTAGAIRRALPQLGDDFFVLLGDAYLDCDMGKIQAAHRASGKLALMTVYRNENRWGASNVEYARGKIIVYDKQHPTTKMKHIDYGLSLFNSRAFQAVPEGQASDLETLCQDLIGRDQLAAFEVTSRFYEIGTPEGLEETRRHLAGTSALKKE